MGQSRTPTTNGHVSISTTDIDRAQWPGAAIPSELSIEYAWWGDPSPDATSGVEPVIVFLHEGLGSIAQWREVPGRVHAETGLVVFAFNRWGYGRSTSAPVGFGVRFMHLEGLHLLPLVLRAARIGACILVGHSDGASISLIATGAGTVSPLGVLAIAPHIYVEPECAAGIVSIGADRERIVAGLARYHDDPGATFAAWHDVWLHPDFQSWDIREYLSTITCGVLAVQGEDDEYATDAMITGIDQAVGDSRGAILVPDCGHIAHRDQPDAITTFIVDFVRSV